MKGRLWNSLQYCPLFFLFPTFKIKLPFYQTNQISLHEWTLWIKNNKALTLFSLNAFMRWLCIYNRKEETCSVCLYEMINIRDVIFFGIEIEGENIEELLSYFWVKYMALLWIKCGIIWWISLEFLFLCSCKELLFSFFFF